MDGVAATRADMVEFSGVFDSWAAWLSTQLHAHASQHASFVSESTEEVTALRTKQQQLAHSKQHNDKGQREQHHDVQWTMERGQQLFNSRLTVVSRMRCVLFIRVRGSHASGSEVVRRAGGAATTDGHTASHYRCAD